MSSEAPPTSATSWRTLLIVAAVALAAYLVWRGRASQAPQPEMTSNVSAPPVPPVGAPLTLAAKMAQLVDTQIPLVMTAGAPVQYGEDEIRDTVNGVLQQLNAKGESVVLIQVIDAAKTVDSYKTVAYDVLANLHDHKASVALQVVMSVLVAATGARYIRSLRMAQSPADSAQGPQGVGVGEAPPLAPFEDPVLALKNLNLAAAAPAATAPPVATAPPAAA